MFSWAVRAFVSIGTLVSELLKKKGRYIPGLDEILEILKQAMPIIAASDHPDAPSLALKVQKVLDKNIV